MKKTILILTTLAMVAASADNFTNSTPAQTPAQTIAPVATAEPKYASVKEPKAFTKKGKKSKKTVKKIASKKSKKHTAHAKSGKKVAAKKHSKKSKQKKA